MTDVNLHGDSRTPSPGEVLLASVRGPVAPLSSADSPFESCGAADRGAALVEKVLTGDLQSLDATPLPLPPVDRTPISAAERAFLLRSGAAIGITSEYLRTVESLGARSASHIEKLWKHCSTPFQRGCVSYLSSLLGLSSNNPTPAPLEWALEELRARTSMQTEAMRFPLSIETLERAFTRTNRSLSDLPPEIIRGIDEFNMLASRLILGRDANSVATRPLSMLNRDSAQIKGDTFKIAGKLPSRTFAALTIPYAELIETVAAAAGDATWSFLIDPLCSSVEELSAILPPPLDERLTAHILAAVLCHNHGVKVEEIYSIPEKDRQIIEALCCSITACVANPQTDPTVEALNDYFEKIGDRPARFEELLFCALIARNLVNEASPGSFTIREDSVLSHLTSFRAGYLNARDLIEMGVSSNARIDEILFKTRQAQLLGLVASRKGALHYGALMSAALGEQTLISPSLLTRSGSELRNFVSVVPTTDTLAVEYRIRRFTSVSKVQFRPDELAQHAFQELTDSGNYPALQREMSLCGLTPASIIAMLSERRAHNLVELETFCESLFWQRQQFPGVRVTLAQTPHVISSMGTYARVERINDPELSQVGICVGYQGPNHVGEGLRHLIHQRLLDGSMNAFARAGETEPEMVQRFIDDAVLHVAGTGHAKIPSRLYPKTHLLLSGAVRGISNNFLTLVLAQTGAISDPQNGKMQVVTAIYHPSPTTLRSYLRKQLQGWVAQEISQADLHSRLCAVLTGVNALLSQCDQQGFTPGQFDVHPQEEEFYAARSFSLTADHDEEVKHLVSDDSYTPKSFRLSSRGIQSHSKGTFESAGSILHSASSPGPTEKDYNFSSEGMVFNPGMGALLF